MGRVDSLAAICAGWALRRAVVRGLLAEASRVGDEARFFEVEGVLLDGDVTGGDLSHRHGSRMVFKMDRFS